MDFGGFREAPSQNTSGVRVLMEIARSIYLLLCVGNELFFGTVRLLGLLAGCMQHVSCGGENYSLTFVFIVNRANAVQ